MGFTVTCGKQNLITVVTNNSLNQGKYATVHLRGIIVISEEGKQKGRERRRAEEEEEEKKRKKKRTGKMEAVSYQVPNVWQAFYKEFSK